MPERELASCDLLVGSRVVDRDGSDLGILAALVIDVESGRVAYALVSRPTGIGDQEDQVVVPWGALRVDTERDRLELVVERRRFDQAPGVATGIEPDLSDPELEREIVVRFHGKRGLAGDDPTQGPLKSPDQG